ncbi:MAG: hypothetical protein OWQ48_03095 [Desulfurococcus sp.]|nr:hypothetical protein [Desulfurococcus sp.]
MYALREALVKTVYIPPYSTQQYVDAYEDIRMVNLLDKIGVIKFRDCRAYADGKIYLASLSAYGEELACSLAQKVILSNEAKIRDEMRRYGVIIPFITSILRCSEIEELKWEYVLELPMARGEFTTIR